MCRICAHGMLGTCAACWLEQPPLWYSPPFARNSQLVRLASVSCGRGTVAIVTEASFPGRRICDLERQLRHGQRVANTRSYSNWQKHRQIRRSIPQILPCFCRFGPTSSKFDRRCLPYFGQQRPMCCPAWSLFVEFDLFVAKFAPNLADVVRQHRPNMVGCGPNLGTQRDLSTIVGQLWGNSCTTSELAGFVGVTLRDVWRATLPRHGDRWRNRHS